MIVAFWEMMSCIQIDIYQHFRGTCCLHLEGRKVSYAGRNAERYEEGRTAT
jgi:hypothetical protein